MQCNGNFKQWFNIFLIICEAWQGYESKAYGVSNHNLKLQSKKLSRTRDIPNFPIQGWADSAFCTRNWSETYEKNRTFALALAGKDTACLGRTVELKLFNFLENMQWWYRFEWVPDQSFSVEWHFSFTYSLRSHHGIGNVYKHQVFKQFSQIYNISVQQVLSLYLDGCQYLQQGTVTYTAVI